MYWEFLFNVLGWPKSSFGFFHNILWKNPNELFGQPNNLGKETGSLFFFLTSLLAYNCFTMVCQFLLYNKVNQLYIDICPHISSLFHLPPTLPITRLQVVTKHRADLPVLCGCFPIAIYFMFGSVHTCMLLSAFSPSPYAQVHSLVGLNLYSSLALRFF